MFDENASEGGAGSAGSGGTGNFPGVNGNAMRRPPPQRNEPHMRTLADGTEVKWCAACSEWMDHYRMGHPLDGNDRVEAANVVEEGEVADAVEDNTSEDSNDGGTFARLRRADLM